MIKPAIAALAILVASCSPADRKAEPERRWRLPQAEEQCRAQPELDWCQHGT